MAVEIAGSGLELLQPAEVSSNPNTTHGRRTHQRVLSRTGGSVFFDAGTAIDEKVGALQAAYVDLAARFAGGVTPDGPPPFRVEVVFGVLRAYAEGQRWRTNKRFFNSHWSYDTNSRLQVSVTVNSRNGDRRQISPQTALVFASFNAANGDSHHGSLGLVRDWADISSTGHTVVSELDAKYRVDRFAADGVPSLSFEFDPSTGTDPLGRRQPISGPLGVQIDFTMSSKCSALESRTFNRLAVSTSIAFVRITSNSGGGPGSRPATSVAAVRTDSADRP